ncbi:hypothetical protein ACS5PK_12170 [Roseateles sp. DB2]|uniref:hypothetical protein n=1 Tax=Roseateles sp. DB2 TaxID=3453717 RepID=UPI003EEAABAF
MKKLFWPLFLLAAWFLHGQQVFSQSRLIPWVMRHQMQIYAGDSKACDAYTDDVEVSLWAEERKGHWEVEGGKAELCDYFRHASAAYVLMDASVHTEFADFSVQRSSFPWTEATLRYTANITMTAPNLPDMHIQAQDELKLVRSLLGVKIKALESRTDER